MVSSSNIEHYLLKLMLCIILIIGLLANNALASQTPQLHQFNTNTIQLTIEPDADPHRLAVTNLLLGKLALEHGDRTLALKHYLIAARLSSNAKIARIATFLTVSEWQTAQAAEAASIWTRADPSNLHAQRIALSLFIQTQQLGKTKRLLNQTMSMSAEQALEQMTFVIAQLETNKEQEILIKLLQQASKTQAKKPALYLSLALLALNLDQNQQAIAYANKAYQLKPSWLASTYALVRIYQRTQQTHLILKLLQRQQQRYPRNSKFKFLYADYLFQFKKYQEAKRYFQLLYKNEKFHGIAAIFLAKIALIERKNLKATRYLQQVVNDKQVGQLAKLILAQQAKNLKQYDTAIQWYQQIEAGEYYFESRIQASQLLSKQGKTEAALALLDKLDLNSSVEFKQVYLSKAEILYQRGQIETALNLISSALDILPDDIDLLYIRAVLLRHLGQYDNFEQDLKRILNQEPNNVFALNALGFTLADRNIRLDMALHYLERALKLAPNNPDILDSIGWLYYRLGDLKQALSYLKLAYQLTPSVEIAAHFGEVKWISGHQTRAKEIWRKALKTEPQNTTLLQTIKKFAPRLTQPQSTHPRTNSKD